MIVVAGESLIDLIERASGGPNPTYEACPGGSPYNCALALGRLGAEVGFLGPFSRDRLGLLMRERLEAVGARALLAAPSERPTALAVVSLSADGQPTYRFYHEGTADRDVTADRVLAEVPSGTRVFQTGSSAFAAEPDASHWRNVAEALSRRGALVSLDVNVRPAFVDDWADYRRRLPGFFDLASLVKVSDEDLDALNIAPDPASLKDRFIDGHGCALLVVTRGAAGALFVARDATAEVPVWRPPAVIDTVGAGDTFMAAILARLAERERLDDDALRALGPDGLADIGRFAAVAAGLNCARQGCDPPTRGEVEAAMG